MADLAVLAPPMRVYDDVNFLAKVLLIVPTGEGDRCYLETTDMLGRAVPLDSYLLARSFSKISGSAASSMSLDARSRTALMLGQRPLALLEKILTMWVFPVG